MERILPTRVEPSPALRSLLVFDLTTMVMNGGREQTEDDIVASSRKTAWRAGQDDGDSKRHQRPGGVAGKPLTEIAPSVLMADGRSFRT